MVSCAKTVGPILAIDTSYAVFLHKELPFGVAMIAAALKFFSAANFVLAIKSSTR